MAVKKKSKKQEKKTETGFMKKEVAVIACFLVSLLLFLSNFGLIGNIGKHLYRFQHGLFGILGYAFPVLLFLFVTFILSNYGNKAALWKAAALFAAVVSLAGIVHTLFGSLDIDVPALYAEGEAGGLFGGLLAKALTSVAGKVGSVLILLALLIICVVFITEKSFVSAVRAGSGKAYQKAREDARKLHASGAAKAEERKRLREERKVTGIDLEATDLSRNQPAADSGEDGPMEQEARIESREDDDFSIPSDTMDSIASGGYAGILGKPVNYEDDSIPFDNEDEIHDAYRRAEEIIARERSREENEPFRAGEDSGFYDDDRYDAEGYGAGGYDGGGYPDGTDIGEHPSDIPDYTDSDENKDRFPEEELPETEPAYGISGSSISTRPVISNPLNEKGLHSYDGERRVVTATGKIIEADTEAVHKRMTEARKNSETGQMRQQTEARKKARRPYRIPPMNLLEKGSGAGTKTSSGEYKETAAKLEQTLQMFGIAVHVTDISCGPSVTRYELKPEQGVKVGSILSLQDDIKLSLAAADIRIEAPIPGKAAIGIEVPNKENNLVALRDVFESQEFRRSNAKIAFALGKDITGQTVVADITKMPHLLIAGATGSGKSVCINTLIMSVLYKYSPEQVRIIMVDPKVVELSVYNGIPHLLIPVVTEPKKASGALNWAVSEMMERYKKFQNAGVRDIAGFNKHVEDARSSEMSAESREELPEKMPHILIIIDELADLMMVSKAEVEDAIVRISQLARAAGIHLVIATQRPSVNVITGLIKANIPSRIAFAVSSGVDSRTILDGVGAERLLGKGDMLYNPQGAPKPYRIQGAFVSDQEIQKVIDYIKAEDVAPVYTQETMDFLTKPDAAAGGEPDDRDELFILAGRFIIEKEKASIGILQRQFRIGFNRAARIMDQLTDAGVVGPEQGTKPREILMSREQFDDYIEQEG